ncbi:choice-of-anchor X domain-containing protein [Thermodesulfobacteriota bacterium]
MRRTHLLLCLALAALLLIDGTFFSGCGGGDGDTPEPDNFVTITGPAQALIGEEVQLSVQISRPCTDPAYLIETVGSGKTVWQNTNTFTYYLQEEGQYDFTASVKCADGRFQSTVFTVTCATGDFALSADREWVAPNSGNPVVFQVDASSTVVDTIMLEAMNSKESFTMYDDGTHGDPVAHDNIFSYLLATSYAEGRQPFQAHVDSGGTPYQTNFINLLVIEMPTDQEVEDSMDDVDVIAAYSDAEAIGIQMTEFIEDFPESFAGTTQVDSISKSDDYILVQLATGAQFFLTFIPEGVDSGTGAVTRHYHAGGHVVAKPTRPAQVATIRADVKDDQPVYIKNYSSLIYSANYRNRHGRDVGETIQDLLDDDARFTDHITWLKDEEVSVDSMTSADGHPWQNYGVLVFHGHGSSDGYWGLGERKSKATSKKYRVDMALNKIALTKDHETEIGWWIFHIHPTVYKAKTTWMAEKNSVDLHGSFFYTGVCHGGKSIAKLFPKEHRKMTNQIGSALFGWSDTVQSGDPGTYPEILPARAGDLFENLLDGDTLSSAYLSSWDANLTEVVASPVLYGNTNLVLEKDASLIFREDFESYPLNVPLETANWDVENSGQGTTYIRKPTPDDSKTVVFVDPDIDSYSNLRKFFEVDVRTGQLEFDVRPSEYACAGIRFEGSLGSDYWDRLGPYTLFCDLPDRDGMSIYGYDVSAHEFVSETSITPLIWYHVKMVFDLDAGVYDLWLDDNVIGTNIPLYLIETAESIRIGTFSDAESNANIYFDNIHYTASVIAGGKNAGSTKSSTAATELMKPEMP